MVKPVIMQRLYIAGKNLHSCAFFHFRQYESGFKNVLGGVCFFEKSNKEKMMLVKEREANKHILKASVLAILFCFLLLIGFSGGLKGTIFHLIVCVLLYDSCRHTDSLQNGYEIFLVMRSGREGREKDFLMTVKINKKNLLVKTAFKQKFLADDWRPTSLCFSHLGVRNEQSCVFGRDAFCKNMFLLTPM